MAGEGNILIVDESAYYALMHRDWAGRIEASVVHANPLRECATTLASLRAFNVHNPLYGPPPISLLVSARETRRFTPDLTCRLALSEPPPDSFFRIRERLLMATPEFLLVRMARFKTEAQLAEIAMNLCARYYVRASAGERARAGEIEGRTAFLTTQSKLASFARSASHLRGSKKALSALRWVLPNSGSPYETKMALLYRLPWGKGGFALPFDAMNYDVGAGKLQRILAQGSYCIDLVDSRRRIGLEYDGRDFHEDASKDKRRLNELKALNWEVFPIDKEVLHDPAATRRTGEQIAKRMKVKLRQQPSWNEKYLRLRAELGLPNRLP